YAKVKKVISVTIAYFDLGQGKDYVYRGLTQFKGIHEDDILQLAEKQITIYSVNEVYQIYPEYWIIKVDQFRGLIQDKLDEWIYFLKNAEIKEDFSAKGLLKAKEKLDKMNLSEEEQVEYKIYLKRLRNIASEQHTKVEDAKILLEEFNRGLEEGLDAKEQEAVIGFHEIGVSVDKIAAALKITEKKVQEIIEAYQKKS
ncbi:MAG: hypothetical protein AAF849_22980, partial [Bacteroidota bacterium]